MTARWDETVGHTITDGRRESVSDVAAGDINGFHQRSDWPLSQKLSSPVPVRSPNFSTHHTHFDELSGPGKHVKEMNGSRLEPYSADRSDVDDGSSRSSRNREERLSSNDISVQRPSRSISPTNWANDRFDGDTVAGANQARPRQDSQNPRLSQYSKDNFIHIEPRDSTLSQDISPAKVSPLQSEFLHTDSRSPSPPVPTSDISVAKREQQPTGIEHAGTAARNGVTVQRGDSKQSADANDVRERPSVDQHTAPSVSPPETPAETQHTQPENVTIADLNRQSSIAKHGLPGYHSRHSSANRYSTTQLPANRERVRYSWQSYQDDEPNRPRIHIIKLVSNTASASSASPQGEALGFAVSPGGRRIAAYNSSRLYILQTAALPVGISQDFSLKRRPLAVELNDNGSLVAILADAHTINIYDLSNAKLRRTRTLKLDFPTDCIAVAPCGGLLASSYEGGIEVFSLAPGALATDRRAVRSPKMDRLVFSEDGSTLLGTTTKVNVSSTVIVNVPVFPAASNGIPTPDELKQAWCSELLHPENIKNSSHAVFMREDRTTMNDTVFAWNGSADTFGILNTSDMQYGNTDFPVIIDPPLSTVGGLGAAIHSCPALDEFGETVAMIVNDRTVRLYIVPPKDVGDDESDLEAHSIDHELDDGYGCPFHELRWVHSSAALPAPAGIQRQVRGRLIVTSPGGLIEQESEDSFEDIEGGRIILFDFDPQFAGQPGQTFVLNLGKSPPRPLEEEEFDVDSAVALIRRRTVKQNSAVDMNARPVALGRAATTVNNTRIRPNSSAIFNRRTASVMSVTSSIHSEATRSLPDLAEGIEHADALEEPFSMQAPRSQASLQRSASNVQRYRVQTLEERNQQGKSADNENFLPLPEYSEEPNAPLPSRFRAMAGLETSGQPIQRQSMVVTGPAAIAYAQDPVPMTAPPDIAETFSANQAFASASANSYANSTTSLSMSNDPSLLSMPRGLLRAYSNAATNIQLGSDFQLSDDESTPVQPASIRHSTVDLSTPYSGFGGSDVSPLPTTPRSTNSRLQEYRFSTPLANYLEQSHSVLPRRSSSSRRPGEHDVSSARQYNMQALRQATATASLFPPAQPTDLVPLPTTSRQRPTGTVAHPVTSWRPPAPSSVASAPLTSGPASNHSSRGHSRKNSVTNKSAFASTAKARKLGFFRKAKSTKGMQSGSGSTGDDMATLDDSKSMVTWMTVSDRRCSIM